MNFKLQLCRKIKVKEIRGKINQTHMNVLSDRDVYRIDLFLKPIEISIGASRIKILIGAFDRKGIQFLSKFR